MEVKIRSPGEIEMVQKTIETLSTRTFERRDGRCHFLHQP